MAFDTSRALPRARGRDRRHVPSGLHFAVYGVFATCPDCTGMNATAVFHKSMEAARRRLSLLEGDLDSGIGRGASERRTRVRRRGV